MATTEQRTGFRLPWAADSSAKTDPAPTDGDVGDNAPVGSAEGTAVEAEVETSQGADLTPDSADESALEDEMVRDSFITNLAGRAGWDSDPLPATAAVVEAPDEIVVEASDEIVVEASDEIVVEAPRQPRPVNPLVAGLVRAMLDAAETARQEAVAGLTAAAKARKDQIQVEATEYEAAARQTMDHDIAEIREWSKAQMARIRGETDVRITDRKRRLEAETGDLSALVQRRVGYVEQAVEAYQQQMDAFFQTLFEQDDPAYLAALAQQLPEPPDLADETELDAWAPAAAVETDAWADPSADELRTSALASEDDVIGQADQGMDAAAIEVAPVGATSSEADAPEAASSDATPAATSAPAEDIADVPAVTLLSVVGLVSVASIAAFKRAVAKAPGVEAISVVSGPAGDFVFTVRHHADTDVVGIVGGLEEFSAVVTNQAEGVLSVTATAPAGIN